jgi:SAM-dependent methyltransferase
MHAPADLPSAWVARFAPLMPPGETLDLACGGGRHARLLAALGHPVVALDRDPQALARVSQGAAGQGASGAGIRTLEYDLEAPGAAWPFPDARFAGIVVTNYLHRPLLAQLARSLAPGGVLVYETFAQGNERFGKPSNPAFLLAPGELLDVARRAGLQVIAYEDGVTAQPRPARVQRLCAAAPDFDLAAAGLDS